jgi:hypothetical protein
MIEHLIPIVKIKNLKQNFYRVDRKEYSIVSIEYVVGLGLKWMDSSIDNVLLSETETMFILNLDSHVVSQEDNDQYNQINEKNKIYMEVRDIASQNSEMKNERLITLVM